MGKKAVKRAPVESSPPSSSFPVGEEAKALFRHQNLLQDYEVLVKETDAKRQSKLEMNQMKLRLVAEVKFLRKKLKSFSERPSAKTPSRGKKQSNKKITPPVRHAILQKPVLQGQSYQEDMTCKGLKTAVPRAPALLDLNQASEPDVEDLEEQEPLRIDSLKRYAVGDAMANDIKLSLHRDFSTETNHVGRRKISWQDQVPLRV